MKNPNSTGTSQCVTCGGRLRNAVFCSSCGHSTCSWACYTQHLAQHATRPGWSASYQGGPRRDEKQDAAGGQAFAS